MSSVPATAARIADSIRFQAFIFGVIVVNAIVLGLETYSGIDEDTGSLLTAPTTPASGSSSSSS